MNIFQKILNENWGLWWEICKSEKICGVTITKLKKTWKAKANIKFKIYAFLLENKYIRLWQYTITELFNIEEENEK